MEVGTLSSWVAIPISILSLLATIGNILWNIHKAKKDKQERICDREVRAPLSGIISKLDSLAEEVESLARFSSDKKQDRLNLAKKLNSEMYPKFLVSLQSKLSILERSYPFKNKSNAWLELADDLTDPLEPIWNQFQQKNLTPEQISRSISVFQKKRINFEAKIYTFLNKWPHFPENN